MYENCLQSLLAPLLARQGSCFYIQPPFKDYIWTTSPDQYLEEEIMSLEVPGTSDLTKKRRVHGGYKSHVTKISDQPTVILADHLSLESVLQLRQQKIQLYEKLATINILDNQILDLLETEQ